MDTSQKLFIPTPVPVPLLKAARALRSSMTNAEQLLWHHLRRRQLGGFRFRRQHPFERFVLDFYCLEVKLAIELDGGQHNEPDIKVHDRERSELLACHGIQVLRFWNNEVFTNVDAVLQKVYDVLVERAGQQHAPPPWPSPAGGGNLCAENKGK